MSGPARSPEARPAVVDSIRPVVLPALVAAAIGGALVVIGLFVDPARTARAYLAAFVLALSLALGALCTVLVSHAIRARWFVVVRRLAEGVATTLLVLPFLFLPLLFGLDALYPWVGPVADPEVAEHVEKVDAWLNVPFFVIRSSVYLLAWAATAFLLLRWSVESDERPESEPDRRPFVLAAVALPVYGFTVTFAAMDWIMSLTPRWYSTVFGLYYWAGGFLAAFALLVVLTRLLERSGHLGGEVAESHYHALGRLLLTFSVFWAYIAFSQGFLIWIADLPREVPWYLARWDGAWKGVTLALLVGQFLVPFALLLFRAVTRHPSRLAWVAGWILLVHAVDVYWLVLPAVDGSVEAPHWLDPAALLLVGGLVVAFGAWRLRGSPVVPAGDVRLEAGRRYVSR